MKKKIPDGDPEDELFVSELQVHNPELGILENRVGKFYLNELFNDSGVDLEETAYWFHTPPGGWNTQPVRMKAAEEAPVTFPEPQHLDAQSGGRVMLADMEEGEVITGVISDCWLYHGIQVDFGGEFDGLVPIKEDTWLEPGVRETLMPGEEVQAIVHKVRQPGLYRWPVQLELLEPAWIAALLPHPDTYQAPINHEWCDDQGWGVEEISAATGRGFEAANYLIPEEQADAMLQMEAAYGFDDPESNRYDVDPETDYILGPGQEMAMDIIADISS